MQKISKSFYLGSIAGAGGLGLLFTIIANFIRLAQGADSAAPIAFLMPGALLSIYAGVIGIILWYKAWSVIQDGNARTTPAKAIGFLFIPFFGFYWVFQAYWGFAKDYNAYIKRYKISCPALPEALFLTTCILTVAGMITAFIPVFNSLFSLFSYAVWIMVILKVCDAINNIVPVAEDIMLKKTEPKAEGTKEAKTSGMAIAALVLALTGFIPFIGLFLAITGLILGIISLKAINRSRGELKGKGMAIAGVSVGGFVILIGLIMLAVMIPVMSMYKTRADEAAIVADMHAINTAVMIYELENGRFPQDLSELVPTYLEEAPTDSWGNAYIYVPLGGTEFEIYSLGSDGIQGNEDDIYFVE